MTKKTGLGLLAIVVLVAGSCSNETPRVVDASLNLAFTHTPADVRAACEAEQKKLKARIDQVGALPESAAVFRNTAGEMEAATTEFANALNPVNFLKYVSPKADVRAAADECETAVSQLFVDLYTREDLYRALKAAAAKGENLDAQDAQLLKEYLVTFKRNGLELSAEKRRLYIEKKKALVKLEAEFGTNLNEYKDELVVTRAELDGLPESFIQGLKTTADGKYRLTLAYPHYYPFMENARNADARRRLEYKFSRRGGERNKILLEEAIRLRHQLATMLGYPNHAAFVLEQRMAQAPGNVTDGFLKPLIGKLRAKGEQDLREMLDLKKEEDPGATRVDAWDWRYYANQLKKKKHDIDSQKIKEYFPLDVVTEGMFRIYQQLLGVKFEAVDGPKWHESAQLYKITQDGVTLAYFYMDLFPREGKYGHAAAFTLVSGFNQADGSYRAPVSAMVCNFNPPAAGKPSLLEHSEVETLFHEFGHIMHQTLTEARYASFSGTSVHRDFVEAPSQMLENWVWEPEGLALLSGHYLDKTKKLPADLVRKMVGAKLHNSGITYLRQASFATLDMEYHTSASVDSTEVYARAMGEVMGIPIQEGTYPQASFGHLMGGYDAGYYGYLWSEVYAADMYTRFAREGLVSRAAGADYRRWILVPGGTQHPSALITGFLGRAPNQEAFLKSLGL